MQTTEEDCDTAQSVPRVPPLTALCLPIIIITSSRIVNEVTVAYGHLCVCQRLLRRFFLCQTRQLPQRHNRSTNAFNRREHKRMRRV